MSKFYYEGSSAQGPVTGDVEAEDEASAYNALISRGISPVVLDLKKEPIHVEDIIARYRRVPQYSLVVFTRQLATMVSAGMTILNALTVLEDGEDNRKFKDAIGVVGSQVETGKSLSEALALYPDIFSRFYVAMVRVGEESGTLEIALVGLAHQLEQNMKRKRQVKSAMVYPIVVSGAAVVIALAMIIFIVPVFEGLFKQFDAELPAPTKALVKTSQLLVPPDGALIPLRPLGAILVAAVTLIITFLLQQARAVSSKYLLIVMVAALVIGQVLFFTFGGAITGSLFEVGRIWAALFRLFCMFIMFVFLMIGLRKMVQTEDGRRFWDALKLKLPIKIGKLMKTIALANFAGNFGTMLKAGVPMLVAVEVVKESVNNVIVEEELDAVRVSIERGYGIAPPLIESDLFPNMFAKMVEVGEQTGKTDEMLDKLNEFYSDEIENTVKALASLVEPVMILVVGVIVGVIVICLFLPIFDIYTTISSQI